MDNGVAVKLDVVVPVLHKYEPPALTLFTNKVPLEPKQTESTVTVGCGVASTVTVTVFVPVQPLAVYSTV